jgi:DNA-directed RNA polymerase specialized sigma subunit
VKPKPLPLLQERPRVRGDCEDGPRPCPWVQCRYHLEHPKWSCALDVADEGPHTQEQVATLLGVSQERVLFLEHRARQRLHARWSLTRRGLTRRGL